MSVSLLAAHTLLLLLEKLVRTAQVLSGWHRPTRFLHLIALHHFHGIRRSVVWSI